MGQENERGELIASLSPWGASIRIGDGVPMSVGWPFPRKVTIYSGGIYISSLLANAWVPQPSVTSVTARTLGVRITWSICGVENAAFLSYFRKRELFRTVLERAGYRVD